MKKKIFCLALVVLLLSAVGFEREATAQARETLRNLNGVGVLIEGLNPEAKKGGLDERRLKAAVELQLRKYGVPVLDLTDHDISPYVYVNITTIFMSERNQYAFNVDVTVRQWAVLPHMGESTDSIQSVGTWTNGLLGVRSAGPFSRAVKEALSEVLDTFINDYLAMNPKK